MAGKTPAPDLPTLALRTFVKLIRAAETVSANVHRHLGAENITMSQFGVLEALHHLGPMSMCDLGRKLLRSNANLTTVVDNLEKRGLVYRQRPPHDRRQITAHLTPEGKALIVRVFPLHARIIVEEMGFLVPEELESLGRICRKLGLKEKIETGKEAETHPGGSDPVIEGAKQAVSPPSTETERRNYSS